ncbi:ABC transporter permease [Buchananella hordeovulneris]|uniref:ABC transporter permease n=1 Tax=Buchananella hordeovulneris TaxID=52770 RepID=UPI0026DBF682|nr:ABC transporter permease [Buchananella hordeovulneris]MDO5080908.1 ABC transporter permease [Buchananella hordeovulneris]
MRTDVTARRRAKLRLADLLRLGSAGLKARPTRAVLSAFGIAIGIAAMIAVVGVSASSRAQLDRELAQLGTNLLRISAGQDLFGKQTKLPVDTVGKVQLVDGVQSVSAIATLPQPVYRSPLVDRAATGGIATTVAELSLPQVVGARLRSGTWLNDATATFPATVLGAGAARRLGVVSPGTQVWLGGHYFTVVGILEPAKLAPELDSAALIGAPVAARLFEYDGSPTTVFERSEETLVERVRGVLARTVAPENPQNVQVSRPSDALAAKAAADQAFTALLVGVGSIALFVGGIGVANTMIISVLERRREIGLRRSLGARWQHILSQFLAEALTLAGLGGLVGCGLGIGVTAAAAHAHGWPFALPAYIVAAGFGATVVIGALAGLYPAVRAARIPPTAALMLQ